MIGIVLAHYSPLSAVRDDDVAVIPISSRLSVQVPRIQCASAICGRLCLDADKVDRDGQLRR
jgi:hypothetical protein